LYGNREFLRSFQLRLEIRESNSSNGSNQDKNTNDNNIITTAAAASYLLPPFETIGFLEAKWLEVLKELVEYGNKNILGNIELYLVMEEEREEKYVKEVTSGILDVKKEERGIGRERSEVSIPTNNNNNQSQFRPRDKNGRFMSSSCCFYFF
jgi:hypothetical protein